MGIERVILDDGKYEIQIIDNGKDFKCLRHGEPWRDLTGDGMAFSLVCKLLKLKKGY